MWNRELEIIARDLGDSTIEDAEIFTAHLIRKGYEIEVSDDKNVYLTFNGELDEDGTMWQAEANACFNPVLSVKVRY